MFESDKSFEMARFIHAILQKYETGRKVLDVGSGLGRAVAFLSERGYDAVGIDASEDMVAWSQKNYPSAAFYTGQQAVFDLTGHLMHWFALEALSCTILQTKMRGLH